MSSKVTDCFEKYNQSLHRLLGESGGTASMDESDIKAAESRLGIELPGALRDYYLIAGRLDAINQAHHRLLPPDGLRIADGKLVFYEENQTVVLWGLDLDANNYDDPSVYQSPGPDYEEWYAELIPMCSVFLTTMIHIQAAFGGLPCIAHASEFDRAKLVAELNDWSLIHRDEELEVHARDRAAIVILGTGANSEIYAGAMKTNPLENLESKSLLRWNFLEGDD